MKGLCASVQMIAGFLFLLLIEMFIELTEAFSAFFERADKSDSGYNDRSCRKKDGEYSVAIHVAYPP
jgi:hypothetical protein